MDINAHAARSLIAMTQRMPEAASLIIHRLRSMEAPKHSVALEVARMTMSHGSKGNYLPSSNNYDGGTNGDTVIVIIRKGRVVTAMLRRSWNQEFTPAVLRVDEVIRLNQEETF